jgi:tetratricopeptide (TPR) repeat protein
VGCLVSLGILGGAFFAGRELLSPGPRQEQTKSAVANSSTPSKDQRAPFVPQAVPKTERLPAADPRAEEQYRLALAWLKRGDPVQARRALEEVIRRFPQSPYAGRAQAQLERLPPASESAAARREQAIAEFRNRYRDESSKGKKHSTITEDDIGGISKIPSDMKAPKVLIPPAPETQSPATAQSPANRLTLVYAYPEDDQVILKVAYQLGAAHQKPVHAAARLTYPAGNSLFAYGAEALAPGTGQTTITVRLTVPISMARPASIRLMLFESQGPMFFSVTVPYP